MYSVFPTAQVLHSLNHNSDIHFRPLCRLLAEPSLVSEYHTTHHIHRACIARLAINQLLEHTSSLTSHTGKSSKENDVVRVEHHFASGRLFIPGVSMCVQCAIGPASDQKSDG
jgi:hypothetical protein